MTLFGSENNPVRVLCGNDFRLFRPIVMVTAIGDDFMPGCKEAMNATCEDLKDAGYGVINRIIFNVLIPLQYVWRLWYAAFVRIKQWINMPGSQKVPLRGFPYGEVDIWARPRSLLRFVPVFGGAYIFRHGAKISFVVQTRCTRVASSPSPEAMYGVMLRFVMGSSNVNRPDMIRIPAPTSFGEHRRYALPPLFLERTGDATLQIPGQDGTWDTIYTFRVNDPTIMAVTWIVALIAAAGTAILTAVVTALLTK